MTLDEINALSPEAFTAQFGNLYEHSPWIAAGAADQRPFASFDHMLAAFESVVEAASDTDKLILLRAHPELAGKAAIDGTLTNASEAEQASAGLDRMLPDEYAELTSLNRRYSERFGFPFIICVRLTTKAGILTALNTRLNNSAAEEFQNALAEVAKIAKLRLEGLRT